MVLPLSQLLGCALYYDTANKLGLLNLFSGTIQLSAGVGESIASGGSLLDSEGNVILTGTTAGMLGGATLLGTRGTQDLVVSKISKTGVPLWSLQIGAGAGKATQLFSTLIDSSDSIILCGQTTGSFQGATQFSAHTSNDLYVMSISPSGGIRWIIQQGTESAAGTLEMTGAKISGTDVYIAGAVMDDILDGTITQASAPFPSLFVMKILSADGTRSWLHQHGTTGSAYPEPTTHNLALDKNNHPIVTIRSEGCATTGGTRYGAGGMSYCPGAIKFNGSTGARLWASMVSGPSGVGSGTLFTAPLLQDDSGNIYWFGKVLSGTFTNATIYGTTPGAYDTYVVSLDTNGGFRWITLLRDSNTAAGSGTGIILDGAPTLLSDAPQNLYVIGYIASGLLTHIPAATLLGTSGNSDGILMAVDLNTGVIDWLTQIGGGAGTSTHLKGTGPLASDTLIVSGATTGTVGGTQVGQSGAKDFLLGYFSPADGLPLELFQHGAGPGTVTTGSLFQNEPNGDFFALGNTSGKLEIPQNSTHQIGTQGTSDTFLIKLLRNATSSWSYQWATQIGAGAGAITSGENLLFLSNGFVVQGTTDGNIDPSSAVHAGSQDIWTMKLDLQGRRP